MNEYILNYREREQVLRYFNIVVLRPRLRCLAMLRRPNIRPLVSIE